MDAPTGLAVGRQVLGVRRPTLVVCRAHELKQKPGRVCVCGARGVKVEENSKALRHRTQQACRWAGSVGQEPNHRGRGSAGGFPSPGKSLLLGLCPAPPAASLSSSPLPYFVSGQASWGEVAALWEQPWASPPWGEAELKGFSPGCRLAGPQSSGHVLRAPAATLDGMGHLLLAKAGRAAFS